MTVKLPPRVPQKKMKTGLTAYLIKYFENSFSIREGRLHVRLSAAVIMDIKNTFSLI